jgi:chaperone required for assembly of F1-ATPase
MSGWAPKRFWKEAGIEPTEGGYTIRLDGRPVRTPSKALLVVPTPDMATTIAAEWDAQTGVVKPDTMPFTRRANSAIDKVVPQFDAVVAMLAEYGGSDLLCYRALDPASLIARQAAAWDPLLHWSATALNVPLTATAGVMHIAQNPSSLATLHGHVAALTPFQLAAFHDLVAISGSLILGMAVTKGRLSPSEAWQASRIDEDWQAELWGVDEEAAELAAHKQADFATACAFWAMSSPN